MENKHDFLKNIYVNVEHPASFSGCTKLYKESRKIRKDITLDDVKKFLQSQDSHTLHGLVPQKFLKKPVLVSGPGILVSSDLIDMGRSLKPSLNRNTRYIIVFIDCFSRKLKIYPLTNKRGDTIAEKLNDFLSHSQYRYSLLWVDEGGEYYSKATKNVCAKYNIKMYSVHNRRFKASLAERVIRTLKQKLYKIMTHLNTEKYIDLLPAIVTAYNNSAHRGLLGDTPNNVHQLKNRDEIDLLAKRMVDQKLSNYGKSINRDSFKYEVSQRDIVQVGTYVRLLLNSAEGIFSKSYRPIFTREIFIVDRVNTSGKPVTYYLRDLLDETIKGVVYRSELSPVEKPTTFHIEKILKTRLCKDSNQKLHLVKWSGYPDKFNTWIKKSDLEKV
ncbi:unnamed protein product [Meganyctiphanes norvegica]|uniref:Integrase catalytic domain-containing protein n=1 Tax=Meganyctiphanes norvegica TaxID=48144 RepID=A0AAV2SEM0_MEGNR